MKGDHLLSRRNGAAKATGPWGPACVEDYTEGGRNQWLDRGTSGEGLGRRLEGGRPVRHDEKLTWHRVPQEIIQRFRKGGANIQLASLKDHSGI